MKTFKERGLEKSFDQFWIFEIVHNGTNQGWVCLSSIPKPFFLGTCLVFFSLMPTIYSFPFLPFLIS
jgi:hypothetical protein